MRLRQLSIMDFMGHEETVLDLPRTGVVLVTGPNGSGKTALVESVAHAVWGKSLYGPLGWQDQTTLNVVAADPAIDLTRSRRAGRSEVVLNPGTFPVVYETATEAQRAINLVVPSFSVWRRACVLSSANSAAAADATDGERKRLLEDMLGLQWVDKAADLAREERRDAAATVADLRDKLARRQARQQDAEESLARAQEALAALEPPLAAKDGAADLRGRLDRAESAAREARTTARQAEREAGRAEGYAEDAEERMQRLAHECPECGRPVDDVLRGELQGRAEDLRGHACTAREHAAQAASQATAVADATETRGKDLVRRIAEARAITAAAERTVRAQRRLEEEIQRLQDKVADADSSDVEVALAASEIDFNEAQAVDQVLGLRGVRASLLAAAATAVAQTARTWLSQLGMPADMDLRVEDSKVLLEVGGRPYRAWSTGQRRRVDVALLLALQQTAQLAAGGTGWTVWVDEVGDGLDTEGRRLLVDVLHQLAEDRAVVVITHDEEMMRGLQPVQHVKLG